MKNVITYLKTLWGAWGNLLSNDVRHDRRLTRGVLCFLGKLARRIYSFGCSQDILGAPQSLHSSPSGLNAKTEQKGNMEQKEKMSTSCLLLNSYLPLTCPLFASLSLVSRQSDLDTYAAGKTNNASGARVAQEWMKYAAILLVLTLGVGNAWGADVVQTYTLSTSDNGKSTSTGDVTWDIGSSAIAESSSNCKLTGTISFTLPSGATLKSVQLTGNGNGWGSGATITFKSGNTTLNTFSSCTSFSLTTNKTDLSYSFTKSGNSSKNAWVASITVTYTPGATCSNKVTLTKAATSNGSFTLHSGSASGSEISNGGTVDNCDDAVVVVKPSASTHYHVASVEATNKKSLSGPDASGNYTITYTKGGNVSSTITVTFEEDPKYTVTWAAGSNPSFSAQTNYVGTALTAPGTPSPATLCPGDKSFVGWTATPIAGETNTVPTDLFTSVSGMSIPAENKTYYAVFAKVTNTYTKITTAADFTSGNYLVVNTANSKAMKAEIYSSNYLAAADVTISATTISNPAASLIWEVKKDGTTYTLYNTSVSKYCDIVASGSYGKMSLTASSKGFTASVSSGNWSLSSKNISGQMIRYNSSYTEFQAYNAIPTGYEIQLYKQGVSAYATTCASCDADPTVGAASLKGSVSLTGATVQCASGVTNIGGAGCSLTSYGFVVGTSSNPTIGGGGVTQHEVGTSIAVSTGFEKALTLAAGTYYVRPYATNGHGTGYGTQYTLVIPTLSSIAVSTGFTKTAYLVGENLDPTGLVITRNFSNGTNDTYTYANHTSEFSFSPSTNLTAGTSQTITITYGGQTTTTTVNVYSVTVNAQDEDETDISGVSGITASHTGKALSAGVGSTKYVFKTWKYATGGQGGLDAIPSATSASTTLTGTPTGDVTVIAEFYKPIVVHYWNNGVDVYDEEVARGTNVTPTYSGVSSGGAGNYGPCDATHVYYYGWSKTDIGSTPDDEATVGETYSSVTADVHYYAVWTDVDAEDYSTSGISDITSTGTVNYTLTVGDVSGVAGVKIGRTNDPSSYSFKIPAGTTSFSMRVRGWNNATTETGSITFMGSATISPTTITPPLAGPFTGNNTSWSFDAGDDVITFTTDNVTSDDRTISISTSSGNRIVIYDINIGGVGGGSGDAEYITRCCMELATIGGAEKSKTYNSVTLQWNDIANVSSWAVTCKKKSDETSAGTPSAITTVSSKKNITFTGLDQYTDYVFTISATAASGYCNTDDVVEIKTPCVNPSGLSITSTGSKWDFCADESMTLTVNGTNISGSATYQWQKWNGSSWDDIDGAESASYTVASMAASNAGQYRCTITNPGSCAATTEGAWVRLWQLHLGDDNIDFTNTGTGTGNNTTVHLNADTHYEFKLIDNNGGWFGLNDKTITATISAFALNGSGANVNVTSGLEGNYTFTINYSDKNNPTIAVTYPVGNQPSGRKIWFDKSIITGWTDAGTGDLVWRIGKKANSMTNKDEPANAFTLVPGTDRFYVYETKEYNGFEAWHVANNVAWSGNSNNAPAYDNHSIYTHYHDQSSTDVKYATIYQKYVIGTSGVTLVPTTKKNTDWYCDFWNVTKTDGMLTHTATITPPTNGTITIANAAQSLEETTTTADLPHRTILTVTATPAPGYQLSSLTVNGVAFTSGNEYILSADATIAATFGPKTINITWEGNGGNTPSPTESSYTYNGSTVSLATVTHATKLFAGWFTDPSAGTQITEIGTTNKPTADVTYYAHWSDGNTVQFHAGVGSVTPTSLTQTTLGGAVAAFPTPTIDCEGWSFAGWKEGSAQEETTTNPEASLYAAGTNTYVPASATIHMYAVWKKNFGGGTGTIANTYNWDDTNNTWSTNSMSAWVGDSNTSPHSGTKCGSNSAGGAYIYCLTKATTPDSLVFYYTKSSSNTTSSNKWHIQTSSDGSSWTTIESTLGNNSLTRGTWVKYKFDMTSYSNKYVRLLWSNGSSASGGTLDDVTFYYEGTTPDAWKWTSSADDYGCTPANQVKTPVISPDEEAQTGDVSVTITCATDEATIRYTTDGTNPTSSSGTVYSGAFTVSCSATVKAIAYKATMDDSEIAEQEYTVTVPTPTFSLPAGTYYDANQSVTLSLPTAHTGTVIKYTTNGDDPTSSSTTYSSAITVTEGTTTIKAIGYNSTCGTSSAVASATYVVRFGTDYTLVTDANDLMAGDQLVIISADAGTSSKYAISTTITANKRTSTGDYNINAGLTTATIYPAVGAAATVQVFTLGGEPDAWTFHETTNNGYLNCPSAGKLTNTATVSNSNKWTIAIESNIATIHNNEEDATIKSNTAAGHVFAAYAPATENVQLVKLYSIPNPDPVIKIDADLSAFSACRGSASDYQSFYISGKNLDGSIVLSNVAPLAGYEFCLTSDGTYTATLELTPVSKTVAKTQVFVRLAAGATAGTKNGNLNAAVSANSLSTNIAVTGSVSTADTYTDQIHNTVVANQCGEYLAPSCPDASAPADESCVETHFKFMGWITEADKNASGVKDDAWYIAHLVTAGTAMTADGTNYYAVWAKEED